MFSLQANQVSHNGLPPYVPFVSHDGLPRDEKQCGDEGDEHMLKSTCTLAGNEGDEDMLESTCTLSRDEGNEHMPQR